TPTVKQTDGRDHNATGFSTWMAGGGVKGGQRYGATDEHGVVAVDNKVHVHDLHATILHLMGLDHEKLTYRYSGRDFRLTGVSGRVVKEIMGSWPRVPGPEWSSEAQAPATQRRSPASAKQRTGSWTAAVPGVAWAHGHV